MEYKEFHYSGWGGDILELLRDEPYVFLLDSSATDDRRGRFSHIGWAPYRVIQGQGSQVLKQLRESLGPSADNQPVSFTPLSAGAVGFIAYDGMASSQARYLLADDPSAVPDACFGLYDVVLTIDHMLKKLLVTSSGMPETRPQLRQMRARERLKQTVDRLAALDKFPSVGLTDGPPVPEMIVPGGARLESNYSREEFCAMVSKAKGHIEQGDIYQVNLAQRFALETKRGLEDSLTLYRNLRRLSPSANSAYWRAPGYGILSSSPELFLDLRGKILCTRPMKGTRPRTGDQSTDRRWRESLLQSEKERAELMMITDLMRNDIGQVCRYGSVQVNALRNLEEYQTVFQTTSSIQGILRDDCDGLDALGACLPGGSITGCPKIRAIQIIRELEKDARGIYTGSLGYVDFNGNMMFNILIRTMLVTGEDVSFYVGSGIVADSQPSDEYEETLVKAKGMTQCVKSLMTAGSAPGRQPV